MKKLAEERITIDPNICSGKPVIKGTRVRVADILLALAEGLSHKEILRNFRQIREEDILAALAFAYCHADGINLIVKSEKGSEAVLVDNDVVRKEELEEEAKKLFEKSLSELASIQEEITKQKVEEIKTKKDADAPAKLKAPEKKDYDIEIILEEHSQVKIFTTKDNSEKALDMKTDHYVFEYRNDGKSWLVYSEKDGVEIDRTMQRKIKLNYRGKVGLFDGYLTTDRMNKIFIELSPEKQSSGRVL